MKKQIERGPMATVIGIFQYQYKNKQSLSIVKPGNQARRFTHISDTIEVCIKRVEINLGIVVLVIKVFTIKDVAKMFASKVRYLH